MTTKTDLTIEQYISPEQPLTLVKQILAGKSGLFPITGQAGTGKTTTVLMIAHQLWQQGHKITFITEDIEFLNHAREIHNIPGVETWEIQQIKPTEEAWINAVNQALIEPSTAIIIELLTFNNIQAALMAAKAQHWTLIGLDTPFVGVDVLYNLRSWGLSNQEILDHVSGVFSQMLLSRLCEDCKQLTASNLEETRLIYPNSHETRELWREIGCEICNYQGIGGRLRYGRCAVFEVLQIDDEVRPLLANYLEHNILKQPPTNKHFTMRDGSKDLVKNGFVGIKTYQREVLQNPLLRIQHLWEQESLRASLIQAMFSRFVTQNLVERIMSQQDFERIVEGERRDVTCTFCDVRGFTSRSEQCSPTEIFLILNRYFQEIIDIIAEYEGTIDKFIGDSIMIVFGAPMEQSDHQLLAVKCAIAIQQKIAQINQNQDLTPIHIGIGINSGEVVAGCLGSDRRMDYTVLGDVVNTAARIESQAQANQILIGVSTYHAIKENIKCETIGSLTLKGKAEPLEVFQVIY